MSVILSRFCFAVILMSILRGALSDKKGYYTIVAPGRVQLNSVFHVSITINDVHEPCLFNISLTSFPEDNKIYGQDAIEVKQGTTKLIKLHAPSHNKNYGKLEVIGYRGIISKDSAIIFFETVKKYWAFIQINKGKFKPGELVEFRIICIDQLTRPAKLDDQLTVDIYDSDNNLINTIFDVKFINGVFRSELQLSNYPVLGTWTIDIRNSHERLAVNHFEVERHVLPKFNVKINTTKVSVYDEQLIFNISAHLLNGNPVAGKLSFKMTYVNGPNKEVARTLTRESQIDGSSTIVFDLKKDLQLKPINVPEGPSTSASGFYIYEIEAIVIENSTAEEGRAATAIGVHSQPYKIELEAPKVFDSDAFFNMKVKVLITDLHNNPIRDTKTPIEIIVGCKKKSNENNNSTIFKKSRILYQEPIGKDFVIFQIKNKNYSDCYLYAEYQKSRSSTKWMRVKERTFNIDVLTESPKEGKELKINITNPEPFKEFSYEIVSRGDIIQSNHVNVPGNQSSYVLRLNATFSMVPKITIYAHLIQNMNFSGQMKDVVIKRAVPNSIKITTDSETKPGNSVNINVETDKGSYIGLMGLYHQTSDNFNEDYVNSQLDIVNSNHRTPAYGRIGDIITFSNILSPRIKDTGGGGVDGVVYEFFEFDINRNFFPESWLFKDYERTPTEHFNILDSAPDTNTTWSIMGFSLNPDTGLAFTKKSTKLKVNKEFFVSMDFPSLVKEAEIVSVPVYISNFMNQDALTYVTIEGNSEDLDILETRGASTQLKFISKHISANNRETLQIYLAPHKQGQYNVTVNVITSLANDSVTKTLNVQSQGINYKISETYLVHLPQGGIKQDEIIFDHPQGKYLRSQRVEISVVADVFRPLIEFLQKMDTNPYGNGEENMKIMISNSMGLRYLKDLDYSDPRLESKMKQNLDLGYQNQLSYRHLDNSFGQFERKSERTTASDTWQTILALWGLKQAKEFVHVDPNVISKGLDYLESRQHRNGCFKSRSSIEGDIKFTALGMILFLMDGHSRMKYKEVIRKGLECLHYNGYDLDYSPISAMSTYALLLGKHKNAYDHLNKLTFKARSYNDGQMVWKKSDTLQSRLETTAGILMNVLDAQQLLQRNLLQIVRGLMNTSKTKDSFIAHIIALQAMIPFAKNVSLNRQNLNIFIQDDQDKFGNFSVNSVNSQDLQTFEINQNSEKISLQSKGQGFAVVDVRYNFNVFPIFPIPYSPYFDIRISTNVTSRHLGVMKICAGVPEKKSPNNLYMLEVYLQSRLIFTENDLHKVENLREDIKSIQFNDNRDKAVVYFELIDNEVCIELEARKVFNITYVTLGWAIAYAADDKGQNTIREFSFNGL